VEEQVCFVPYALPGDRIRVRIERQAKGVLWGAIEEFVEASPHRVGAEEACCPVQGSCSACGWLHFGYPGQAEWKRRIVSDSLQRLAKIEADVEWVEDAALRRGYRTRGEFHGDGKAWGFYLRGTHEVQPVRACPLCHPRLNEGLRRLWEAPFADSVEMTVNPEGDEIQVWTKRPRRELSGLFSDVNSLHDREKRASFLFDGVPVVNGTFTQSSLLLNRLLVKVVHECVGSPKRVLDLYCGNGNFTLGLEGVGRVVGIDHNRAVVEAAASRARGDWEYRAGDEELIRRGLRDARWDVVVIDPPRTGAKEIVGDISPERVGSVVYVSCDPATLARDLKTMTAAGWKLERVVAVDMFPNTPHVETVCKLER
jgi:23S rRNA (uracil1939-C5)-methyltransferase